MDEYSFCCWGCVFFKVLFLSELLIILWKLCHTVCVLHDFVLTWKMKLKIAGGYDEQYHYTCTASFVHHLHTSKRCKKQFVPSAVPSSVPLPQLIDAVQTPETRLWNFSKTVIFTPQTWPLCFCFVLFFRVVKEEISDDSAKLPCFNGRVVSWVRC